RCTQRVGRGRRADSAHCADPALGTRRAGVLGGRAPGHAAPRPSVRRVADPAAPHLSVGATRELARDATAAAARSARRPSRRPRGAPADRPAARGGGRRDGGAPRQRALAIAALGAVAILIVGLLAWSQSNDNSDGRFIAGAPSTTQPVASDSSDSTGSSGSS